MSSEPSEGVLIERITGLADDMRKMEISVNRMSETMLQMVEFKKEFEFLNSKTSNTEKRLIALEGIVREGELANNSQRTTNRMLSAIFSLVASAGLAIGLYMAGSSSKTTDKINELDKDVSVLQAQTSRVDLNINGSKN